MTHFSKIFLEVDCKNHITSDLEKTFGIEDPFWDVRASTEAPMHSPFFSSTPTRREEEEEEEKETLVFSGHTNKKRMSFKNLKNIKKATFNRDTWFFS